MERFPSTDLIEAGANLWCFPLFLEVLEWIPSRYCHRRCGDWSWHKRPPLHQTRPAKSTPLGSTSRSESAAHWDPKLQWHGAALFLASCADAQRHPVFPWQNGVCLNQNLCLTSVTLHVLDQFISAVIYSTARKGGPDAAIVPVVKLLNHFQTSGQSGLGRLLKPIRKDSEG